MTLICAYAELLKRVKGVIGLVKKKYSHIRLLIVILLLCFGFVFQTNGYDTRYSNSKKSRDMFINSPQTQLSNDDLKFQDQLEKFEIVKMEEVQVAVKQNPEAVPNCVQKSIKKLESLLTKTKNKNQALLFIERLKACVTESSEHPISIQAVCLRLAEDLRARFPQVKGEVIEIFSLASREAKSTLNFADSLTVGQ